VVDDASPDGTGRLADRLAGEDTGISVLHRMRREGLGRAYAAGFAAALAMDAPIICQMDADLSHDPEALPALVTAIRDGRDIAIGSRYVPGGATVGWSTPRRLLSRGGNWYARRALGLTTRDATSGFRAYRTDVLARLRAETCDAAGYAFQVEMTDRAEALGADIVEVPIHFVERRSGHSKMTGLVALEAMWLVTRWGVARVIRQLRSAT
jgi:dolichol-phosphate mannosyltransferase